jgi:F0F1-type ATP synthase delta subunit
MKAPVRLTMPLTDKEKDTIQQEVLSKVGAQTVSFNVNPAILGGLVVPLQRDRADTLQERVQQKTNELKEIHKQILHIEKMASLGKLSATVAHELNRGKRP